MRISFNLIDEPWIPCTMRDGGARCELGLRETLARAPEIREIDDPSPLITIALYRLLLAILHRNFGPADVRAWSALWSQGRWHTERLGGYFACWRDRFDLFDDRYPFYQARSLDFAYEVSVAKLTHELAVGNNATLFDHTTEVSPPVFTAARAARNLLAHQSFAVGGFVSLEKGQDAKLYKSATAAPLAKTAVSLVKGPSLFHTLMLNLHAYNPEDDEPFACHGDDRPAWERDEETRAGDRFPTGYLDLLTWQSRRIRLHPAVNADGTAAVRNVVIMKGAQFPEGYEPKDHETMAAFKKNPKAKPGQDPDPAVAFEESRAIWRDSLALVQSVPGVGQRSRMLDWVNDLTRKGILRRANTVPLELFGMAADRASVLLWRHERLPLPLVYLDDKDLLDKLGVALGLAERAGSALRRATRLLATLLLAPESDQPEARRPAAEDLSRMADRLTPERAYWADLELRFKRFLVDLAEDSVPGDGDQPVYGVYTLPRWAGEVEGTARAAFQDTVRGLDSSARTLKAVAVAERRLRRLLHETLEDATKQREGEAA